MIPLKYAAFACLLLFFFALADTALSESPKPVHGIAMSGLPKYKAGFTHFEYADPEAPKGGELHLASIGSFDSFNPFIVKGVSAAGIGAIYDTLMVKSDDEPFSEYAMVAEKIEVPEDRSWTIFHLNPKAVFHDGHPVDAEDVIFSFNMLIEKGNPFYKKYYADVKSAVALDKHRVKFEFGPETNAELPLIMGQLAVLPKHYWEDRDFTSATLEAPLGGGPYKIASFSAGKTVRYERVKDYWAADLPVNKGRYNFDALVYDYYRDTTIALQAFKAGEYDFRQENTAKDWATAYTGPAFDDGYAVTENVPHQRPQGMQAFIFNTRKPIFQDRKVRWALAHAFDFEWSNKHLFYGQYKRTESFFSNSELASSGLPKPEQLKLLNPLKDLLPPEVFTAQYRPPSTDGSGNIRSNLRTALGLLKEAGWTVKDKRLTNAEGETFDFEILLIQPEFERVVLPFSKNLERLGVTTTVRVVDASQYVNRLREFDFDLIVGGFGQSLSPGNEQRDFWSSEAADIPGSRNLIGIKDKAIDALIEHVIRAADRESLLTAVKALDRALLWGHYVIPHWHIDHFRIAYWNKFSRPKKSPLYDVGLFNWWVDANKREQLVNYNNSLKR